MAVNSIYNNITRMTGLSGLDVDSMVYQLMQVERTKVDKVSQNRQLLIWKQDSYREVTSLLQSFNDMFFNPLKPSTDMRSSAIYNAFAIKYDGSDTGTYFTATASGSARTGDYTIKNIQTALAAKVTGNSAAGGITGAALDPVQIGNISAELDNNRFYAEFNGQKIEIVLDPVADAAQLGANLQSKLDAAFGKDKIKVAVGGDGALTFTTDSTNALTFSNTINGGYASIFNTDLSGGITPTGQNNRFKITLGTETKEFALTPGKKYDNTDAVAEELQRMINGEVEGVDGFGANKITVKNVNNKIVLESVDTAVSVSASAAESGGLEALGLKGVNTSNKISLDAHISDISGNFANPLTLVKDADGNDISFSINGQSFSFDSSKVSLNDIMAKVNSNAAAGVRMSYDSLNDKFILESKTTGAASKIIASDSNGGLLGALSLTTAGTYGRDAKITYNDGVNGDQDIYRSTNSFNINGIGFNLKKDYTGSVNLSVSSDPTKAVELIKSFVDKYNEVLDKINTKLSEPRNYDYLPLTDEQKEAMKDDDIKQWEDKAKSGLLAGDSILQSIATQMRNSLTEAASAAGITLASIGIKSSSWVDKGKLYVDENKLKNALAENPDQVFDLFTKQSATTYTQAVTDPSLRSERYNGNGLVYRLYDIIQDNIRTNTIGGHRGALLEKAGAVGDRSQYSNSLYSQIADYDERIAEMNDELTAKENSYYDQFSKLETMISQMNAQSNWLAQQFA